MGPGPKDPEVILMQSERWEGCTSEDHAGKTPGQPGVFTVGLLNVLENPFPLLRTSQIPGLWGQGWTKADLRTPAQQAAG